MDPVVSVQNKYFSGNTTELAKVLTIGIAERAVRRVKEGTSAALLQAGLDET